MGSYDYIDHEMPCPICKTMLRGFHTKDGPGQFETVAVDGKNVQNFYDECPKCNAWVEVLVNLLVDGNQVKRMDLGVVDKKRGECV